MADLTISGNYPPPSLAFGSLPAAASSTGLIYSVSDAGNVLFRSNGTSWKPIGGQCVLASSAAAVTAPASDTNENTLATIVVPANILGANGKLLLTTLWTYTNSANVKTLRARFDGAAGTEFLSAGPTTTALAHLITIIQNRNATNSQVGAGATAASSVYSANTATKVTASVDTTTATSVVISGQKATGTETLILEEYTCILIVP